MSSIMRARSALTGRWEAWEVIGSSSPKPKVAGPSMLGIGCPDRHALPITHTSAAKNALTVTRRPPARAGSFVGGKPPFALLPSISRDVPSAIRQKPDLAFALGLLPMKEIGLHHCVAHSQD